MSARSAHTVTMPATGNHARTLLAGIWVAVTLVMLPAALADAAESLEAAIRAGDAEATRAALADGADPDQVFWPTGTSALTLAAIRGETEIVGVLLEAGADPNWQSYRGVSALSATVRSCRGNLETVEVLLDAGADTENRSGASLTPLLVAAEEGRPGFAKLLIERGADINAVNAYGDGLLNLAIYYRELEIISLAIDNGVDTEQLHKLFRTYIYDGYGRSHSLPKPCA